MDIKTKIGRRIAEARRERGYTLKQLAAKTVDLKSSRISNWEQGTRTPGPNETKQLARALGIAPAYLLCLTDDEAFEIEYTGSMLVPVLPLLTPDQASSRSKIAKHGAEILKQNNPENLIPVPKSLMQQLNTDAFCLKIPDESMDPRFTVGDLVLINTQFALAPGDYILALIAGQKIPVIRKYREINIDKKGKPVYELVAINDDWPKITIDNNHYKAKILGSVVELRRKI